METRKVFALLVISISQGIISMGYQILGSRLLYPYFGSTIIVWSFLISTFLLGFCAGSFVGGYLVRTSKDGPVRVPIFLIGTIALASFAFTSFCARPIMESLIDRIDSLVISVMISNILFFFIPIVMISMLSPILTQLLSRLNFSAGSASGIIYGTSTIGNIIGIMATTFLLIPNFPVSEILYIWIIGVCVLFTSISFLKS